MEQIDRHTQLFVGTGPRNDGVVTTEENHLQDTTRPIGHSIRQHDDARTQLFVGVERGVNEGVVTTNPKHLNGATREVGFTTTDQHHGTELHRGLTPGKNHEVVSTNIGHAGGETEPIGFTHP